MNRLLSTLVLLLFIKFGTAQIKGKVLGANEKGAHEALPGVNVHWKGTSVGTATDADGNFKIAEPDAFPAKLVISMVGYASDTLLVNSSDQNNLKIVLKNSVNLNEVKIEAKQSTTMNKIFTPINTEVISSKELLKAACCNLSESFSTNASVDVAFTDAVSGAKKNSDAGPGWCLYTNTVREYAHVERPFFCVWFELYSRHMGGEYFGYKGNRFCSEWL